MIKRTLFALPMAMATGVALANGTTGLNLNDVEPVTATAATVQPVAPVLGAKPSATPGQCTWESVARKWQVNPHVLYAIAKTESNLNPRAVNRSNANGSEDIGMMQINSWWLPQLAKLGITRADLFVPCVSLDVAGWILSQNMERHGNTWKAIGAYNAVTPSKQQIYAEKVFKNIALVSRNGTR